MSSTFLTLCQKFRRECGISGSGPSSVTSQTGMMQKIVEWVADADDAIRGKYLDWGFLHEEFEQNTVVNEKDISAPSDLGKWDEDSFYLNYTSDSYRKLSKKDYFEWRNTLRLGTQTADEPYLFIVKPNKSIILHPKPDGAYTLTADYWKTGDRMTANTDTSLIPTKFDRLILMQAKIYWATHEGADYELQLAMNEYKELMGKLEGLYLKGHEPFVLGSSGDMRVIPE